MGLMQIAEPGLSAAPHEERLAVGIDLGTTNSLVASVVSGAAEVIRDDEGGRFCLQLSGISPTAPCTRAGRPRSSRPTIP